MYDIGTVNTHELRFGERLLNFLHVHQAHDRIAAVCKINLDIVLQTVNIKDVIEHDFNQFILAFDKDKAVVRGILRLADTPEPFQCPVGTCQKIIIADRLHEIINGIGFVTIDGILTEGGCKDDLRLLGKNLGKLESAEFRHLNIQENEINPVLPDNFNPFYRTVEDTDQIQEECLPGIACKQFGSQRFIVNDYAV